jgi:hypothetical protein
VAILRSVSHGLLPLRLVRRGAQRLRLTGHEESPMPAFAAPREE